MSLLEQNITRKGRVDDKTSLLEFEDDSQGEKYDVEVISDSAVYAKKSESNQLPGLYYLISWKNFTGEKNTWEPASAIQHLRRLVSIFHKEIPNKPIANSTPVDIALPMARPTVEPGARNNMQKQVQPAKASSTRKHYKNEAQVHLILISFLVFPPKVRRSFCKWINLVNY